MCLSKDIFEIYASYKSGTAKVISWLTGALWPGAERNYLQSILELRKIADLIILRSIPIPDKILKTFRKTLQSRKRLACFYQACDGTCNNAKDSSHDFFNRIFEEVLLDLEEFNAQRKEGRIQVMKNVHKSQIHARDANTIPQQLKSYISLKSQGKKQI